MIAKVLLLDVRYVLSYYVMNAEEGGVSDPANVGNFFASHGKMFTHALVKFFESNTNKLRYLETRDGSYSDYRASRLRMDELKMAIDRAEREAVGSAAEEAVVAAEAAARERRAVRDHERTRPKSHLGEASGLPRKRL